MSYVGYAMTNERNSLCSYKLMENGIHRFTLHQSTRAAVDVLFDRLIDLIENPPDGPDAVQLYLYDSSEALPPLQHTVNRTMQLRKSGIAMPPSYGVVLYRHNSLINIVQTLIRTVSWKSPTRFFQIEEEERAINWLLEQKACYELERS